jgi:tetratricopeptide (TPR) repeat protein
MKSTLIRTAALTALSLAAAASLRAGAECRVKGVVIDSAGNPVEGVEITITSPALGTVHHTTKTGAKGDYGALLADCTIPYRFKYSREGFVPQELEKKIAVGDTGVIDMRLQKMEEARAKAQAAAPMSPNDKAVVSYNAGVDALKAGNSEEALAKFQDAVAKNPDLLPGWQALAQIAYQKKDWKNAVEYGQKATDLDPDQPQMYAMLADASRQMGDTKAAEEWTKRYAEANPDSPEILYNKGIEAYNKGKMKEAETSLAKAIEAKPDFALAHFWLGMAAFNQNNKTLAKTQLEKYLELDPKGEEAGTAKEILPLLK